MARSAKGNQVLLGIVPSVTAEVFMVNLEIGHNAAELASPTVSTQHPDAKLFVQFGIKPQARTFWLDVFHGAFSGKWSRNAFLSSPGRNLKKRRIDCSRTCELPFSRFAPAKKSAQIISRQ